MSTTTTDQTEIHERVRERYADAALSVLGQDEPTASSCSGHNIR